MIGHELMDLERAECDISQEIGPSEDGSEKLGMEPVEPLLFHGRLDSRDCLEVDLRKLLDPCDPFLVAWGVRFGKHLGQEGQKLTCHGCLLVLFKEDEAGFVAVGDGGLDEFSRFDAFAELGLGQLERFVRCGLVDGLGGEEGVHFFGDGVLAALGCEGGLGGKLFPTACCCC